MEYSLVAEWLVLYIGLMVIGLPIAARICSSLPGRGAGFSLGFSLTIVTIVGFWVGHLALGWVALFAGLAALTICAVVSVRGDITINRRAAAEVLIVFTLVYLSVLAVRAVDPGITPHGEKFLDFGLIMSIYRAPQLPPEDFWFAGKSVIYYYGGHLLGSFLIKLTNTHPWYGFNLAMAGFYGMLATGAYELAGAVAIGRNRHVDSLHDAAAHDSRVVAGATAVFFTICAGTLSTVVRLFVKYLPEKVRDGAVQAFAAAHSQLTASKVRSPILPNYDYKLAGRILPLHDSFPLYNPFPLFAIIRGDFRPYLLSTPFLLVVVGLCYAYYRTPESAFRRRRVMVFGMIPIIAGFMSIINTWSLAIVVGMVWLTLTFSPARLHTLLPTKSDFIVNLSVDRLETNTPLGALARTAGALLFTAIVGTITIVVALPFFLGPVQERPSTPLVILESVNRSPLDSLLLIHGAFLAVFGMYYLAHVRAEWTNTIAIAGVLGFIVVILGVPGSLAPLVLFGIPVVVGWYFLSTGRTGFECILIVAGFGLVLLAELVYLKPGAASQFGSGRFSTVVKTYMPTWVLWSSAVGIVLPRLVRGRGEWLWTRRQQIGIVLVVLLVISTGVYGVVALRSHFADPYPKEPTLDGLAAAEREIPGQVEAIRWLYNRTGSPTIVSAPGFRIYQWSASPAASLTGLPTVAGVKHEIQFRGRRAYFTRVRDVNVIYRASGARRVALLKKYNVQYIYVGPTERLRYDDISPFSELCGVRIAIQAGNVTIYAVNQTRLRACPRNTHS